MEVARPKKKTKKKSKHKDKPPVVVEEQQVVTLHEETKEDEEITHQQTNEETVVQDDEDKFVTPPITPPPITTDEPEVPYVPPPTQIIETASNEDIEHSTTPIDSTVIESNTVTIQEIEDTRVATPISTTPISTTPIITNDTTVVRSESPNAIDLNNLNESGDVTLEGQPSAPLVIVDEPIISNGEVPTAPVINEAEIRYPRLDSLIEATLHNNISETLEPFTEEDLALMYVNPQLVSNGEFVDTFIRESEQSHHPLYELLTQYLKARLNMKEVEAKLSDLKKLYQEDVSKIWEIEEKSITSTGRCRDGSKVNHTHTHKFAQLNQLFLDMTSNDLKQLRTCLEEDLCIKSYSTQLAHIHVEYHLHQLLQSIPGLVTLPSTAPVTGFIPDSPPGALDSYTIEIRNCISVLFMFERRPVRDKTFSTECRQWLDLMINSLLRIASLSDHQFILNHLLRCPSGVGEWGVQYLQPLSPLSHTGIQRSTGVDTMEYSLNWTSSIRDCPWGGPILDHWVTMLCTMLMPIKGREEMLCMLKGTLDGEAVLQDSQRWTLVEEDMADEDVRDEDSGHLELDESDYISFLDQFPLNDIFKYILQVSQEGSYSVTSTTSHQMLQLISFSTCLIRIFGTVFASLRQSRYKEFVKQVGRTVRQIVHYVADHWVNYKAYRQRRGEAPSSVPYTEPGPYRYTLDKLQTEFDQFVLRATQWILTAHKLGAWQFMADMPYSSISLSTLWKILWTLYHYQFSSGDMAGIASLDLLIRSNEQGRPERRGSVLSGRVDLDQIPGTREQTLASIRDPSCHSKFIDVLMKTYTSEAVFLLTTFVNMARSRTGDCEEERVFVNTITEEIFQFTQVEEYAREAYSRTGCNLLNTIASVHPFILSVLLSKAHMVINEVGENCVLLFKELPLHLWVPSREDMSVVYNWLTSKPLNSNENNTAKIIISGLNWGVKENDEGDGRSSVSLILPLGFHREMALYLVEAGSRHLSTLPGGHEYSPGSSSIRKYTSSIRSMMSTEQSDFSNWLWEVVLMLKLHPTQISLKSILPPSPVQTHSTATHSSMATPTGAKDSSIYKTGCPEWDSSVDTMLPDLSDTSVERFGILKDCVEKEGILAYYVALCLTNLGSLPDPFIRMGLPMLKQLIEQGYYLPVLRVVGNVVPLMYGHRKALLSDQGFISLVLTVANADANNVSYKDLLTWNTPSKLIIRRLSALITTQIHHYGSTLSDKQLVVVFWLELLFSIPNWMGEASVLYLLNGLCVAVFGNMPLEQLLLDQLLDQYTFLQPLQTKNKRLLSTVTSSVMSLVSQEGEGPSLFNNISVSEYPWLCYYSLRAEQIFEEREGIWKTVLTHLKKDPKMSFDNAFKKAMSDLHHPGSMFVSSQLSIFRWGRFAVSVDHTFPLTPFVWQRFFALYLQRPILDLSSPERGSLGLRLFTSNQAQSLRRDMKSALSKMVTELQQEIDEINRQANNSEELDKDEMWLIEFLPNCYKYYQTLKLWIQEPRLHEATLHLPSLPQQYDAQRLALVFSTHQEDWMELVRVWDVRNQVKVMVQEWGLVMSYQNPLPCRTETLDINPETAAARIEKRLCRHVAPVNPSPFQFPNAPFQLLSIEVLLSKDTLLTTVIEDVKFVAQQARIFSERCNNLSALDSEYITGIPDLYPNIDRQFHVTVPCRSKFSKDHVCLGPATIVFRFKEMTPHSHWDERLKDNRRVHNELVQALAVGVPLDICKAVARTEHAVSELLKLAVSSNTNNEALSSGVALFYEILKFISVDIEQFPPSSQFFTSSIEILGQEFIQNDPSQTPTILQLILNQRTLARILAPLFLPNLCPNQFLSMYGTMIEVAVKIGPEIAFSLLSKFNVGKWLEESTPPLNDCHTLLEYIFGGIKLSAGVPSQEIRALLEIYLTHLKHTVDYQFPSLHNDALYHLVSGTDVSSIVPECWDVVLDVVCPGSTKGSSCRLGLQQTIDTAKYINHHFTQKRTFTMEHLYDLIPHNVISSISSFVIMLCDAIILKTVDSIDLGNTDSHEGHDDCWRIVIESFTPWIFPLQVTESSETVNLYPCKVEDTVLLNEFVKHFVHAVSTLHNAFRSYNECSLSLLWRFYCNRLSLSTIPDHVLQCYHAHLVPGLEWKYFLPDLPSMDLMLQLKKSSSHSSMSFIFLSDIFPVINWKRLSDQYISEEYKEVSVKFHLLLLQLIVMLSAEPGVMEKKGTKFPYLLSDAKNFNFYVIDAGMFNNVLQWLKDNCHPPGILQPGSPLSSCLRFLQAVASFPTSDHTSHDLLRLHQNGWDKRYHFIRLIVEITSNASQKKDTHNISYADVVAFMIQSSIDISVFEPNTCGSPEITMLIQEILHLFNICNPSKPFQHSLVNHLSSCLTDLPNAQYICVPIISAACRSLVSVPLMCHVTESAISAYFKYRNIPQTESPQLPVSPDGYGWKDIQLNLVVPTVAYQEYLEHCIMECACLNLHTILLQKFAGFNNLETEYDTACEVVQWSTKLKPKAEQEVSVYLIWEKAQKLLLRQIKYGGNVSKVVPHFTTFATALMRYGEDKATEGLLGAIGLGKRSSFSINFRLIARILATFILCQMPMDSVHSTVVRITPNAPGHIKTPSRQYTVAGQVLPCKQADHAISSLEGLLNSKNYSTHKTSISYSLEFINDPRFCLFDTGQLLVYLLTNIYCNERCLDVLRVIDI